MKMHLAATLLATLLLAACRSAPIIDTQGVDQAKYQRDLGECENYAAQVNTGGKAAKSAAGGAIVGAALGAIFGNSTTVARGVGTGAVIGGAQGAAGGETDKDRVLRNCLSGRGYRVLN